MYVEFEAKEITTRKAHRCEWCDEPIPSGSKAFYRDYLFEGQFTKGRMHMECFDAMSEVDCRDLEDGWRPGDYKRGTSEPW